MLVDLTVRIIGTHALNLWEKIPQCMYNITKTPLFTLISNPSTISPTLFNNDHHWILLEP